MHKKDGSAALLGLLIVLVIGMMIYFLDMKAIFGPGGQLPRRFDGPQDHPWQMDDLLIPENQAVEVPGKKQPQLLDPVLLTASVQRNNVPRGAVTITFGKDRRVIADWSCQYEYDKKTYHVQTQMKGNIVPSQRYSDADNNKDNTRLFFITKGPYTQMTQSPGMPPQTEQGTSYILGWLRPDNTAEGTITITTDQSWSAVYSFHTTPQPKS